MHRRPLLALLDGYLARHPEESGEIGRVRGLIEGRGDCFERRCLPGHITASSWIVSADGQRCLLTHHRKLGRWLQLGGHADGDPDAAAVALREAQEESGMQEFELVAPGDGCPVIDVDIHTIPPYGGEPEHAHHDVRFLLRARPGQSLAISQESTDLRWFEWDGMPREAFDDSLARLARKARALLEASSG
jgi:8-oxo-dGTP pyrophosphatase MutT (NUDIX family)